MVIIKVCVIKFYSLLRFTNVVVSDFTKIHLKVAFVSIKLQFIRV